LETEIMERVDALKGLFSSDVFDAKRSMVLRSLIADTLGRCTSERARRKLLARLKAWEKTHPQVRPGKEKRATAKTAKTAKATKRGKKKKS